MGKALKFETFTEQFPRRLEKALPGFRVIRHRDDELEYEYRGFDNALDMKTVYEKFQKSRTDLNSVVSRYTEYVQKFAEQSHAAPPPVAVKHYDGYSEKEADWFSRAAAERSLQLQKTPVLAVQAELPSPVKHNKVIKAAPRQFQYDDPTLRAAPARPRRQKAAKSKPSKPARKAKKTPATVKRAPRKASTPARRKPATAVARPVKQRPAPNKRQGLLDKMRKLLRR